MENIVLQMNGVGSANKQSQPVVPVDNINLCFVGGVSTGKSTILNAIFCEELTQCKIKRTTMVPTIYIENENTSPNITPPETIFKLISNKNKEIIEQTESGNKINKHEYDELKFNVGKLDINVLNGSYVNVYDIPGLNDARTKNVYYSYLDENFTKFNLVVLLVDIHSGLNTSDEIDIVNFITNHTKYELETNNKQIYTLVVVNKADDMQVDEDEPDKLNLTGELSEMFEQVETTITSEFDKHGIQNQLIGIIPLCAIDSYLYRMVKKHGKDFKLSPEQILKIGINENGKKFSILKPATQEQRVYEILNDETFINTMIKLSGFSRLESILHKFLNENDMGKEIRIKNLLCALKKYPNIEDVVSKNVYNIVGIENHILQIMPMLYLLKAIDEGHYEEYITTMLLYFNTSVEAAVCSMGKTQILAFYDALYTRVFEPYFDKFCPHDYPDYITERIITLIHNDFTNRHIHLEILHNNFTILKKIKMFNSENVLKIFQTIMTSGYGKQTIRGEFATLEEDNIKLLIGLFKECESLQINISQFIRFVLINLYEAYTANNLYKKYMLFKKHGEIPMCMYLSLLVQNKSVDEEVFITGLTQSYVSSSANALELYYISYEKQNNALNFVDDR